MIRKITITIVVVFLLTSLLWGLKIGGKVLPDKMKAGENELLLNGAGLRKKLIIKVYAGALYLMQKSSDANAIIEADEPMTVKMHFIYKAVAPEKLIDAWNTGFDKSDIADLQEEIKTFNSYFTEDAKKDDVYDIIYVPEEGTSVYMNNELKGTISGLEFKKAVFSIWLGEQTELPKLKKAMLGE
ncbi:MAG: chalcone isomerase family protein [Candidatus Cloacimonetes bacterium]|nr:chalcone isomerase family protein [Candidatus Cloacimonadota bacterium]